MSKEERALEAIEKMSGEFTTGAGVKVTGTVTEASAAAIAASLAKMQPVNTLTKVEDSLDAAGDEITLATASIDASYGVTILLSKAAYVCLSGACGANSPELPAGSYEFSMVGASIGIKKSIDDGKYAVYGKATV